MPARPTGRLVGEHMPSLSRPLVGDHAEVVVAFDRHFALDAQHVWAAITQSALTSRWYGPWRWISAVDRTVEITMTAEARSPRVQARILECDENRSLTLQFGHGRGAWRVTLYLDSDRHASGPSTTVSLVQSFTEAELLEQVGPGWDYYLDRLVAAETGADPDQIAFAPDYMPGLVEHYRGVVRQAIASGQHHADDPERDS